MKIITDSREQRNQHILQEFSKQDIPFKVKKLNFGDYSIEGHEDKIMIERKAHLTELAGCFCKGRTRFEAEFIRAYEAGAKIILLIEEHNGREKMIYRRELDKIKSLTDEERWKKTWRSNFTAVSMIASLDSWIKKYNISLIFCKKSETGKKIVEILKSYIQDNSIMI